MERVFDFMSSYLACLIGVVLGVLVSSLYLDMGFSEEMSSIRPYLSALILAILMTILRKFEEEE